MRNKKKNVFGGDGRARKTPLLIMLTEEERQKINVIAYNNGMSTSTFVRTQIIDKIQAEE